MVTEYFAFLFFSNYFNTVVSQSSDFISDKIDNLSSKIINGIPTPMIDPDLLEDSLLTTDKLIAKYGYRSEVHKVVTDDGYILEMHRIPNEGGRPVLIMHGLLDSSASWILMGPKQGLGYLLADLGYDVWLGNTRGNRYSKAHVSLNPKNESKYWRFTFHESGQYDLPASIDYILNLTNFEKLHFIGHSQGSAIFWVMCDLYPEYNDKVILMQALGPVAYNEHCRSPVTKLATAFVNSITILSRLIGLDEFLPNSQFMKLIGHKICNDGSLPQFLCKHLIFLVSGYNDQQLNKTMLPVIFGHIPAGASSDQVIHFGQLKRAGKFQNYDHGMIKNLRKYGSIRPPQYDLSKVRVKVALHYSLNDWLSEPRDVERLHQQISNPIGKFLVKDKNFNHIDFMLGIDARELLFNKVAKIMELVERGEL